MTYKSFFRFLSFLSIILVPVISCALDVSDLKLIPFPKQIDLSSGMHDLEQSTVLETNAKNGETLWRLISDEFQRAGLKPPRFQPIERDSLILRISNGNHVDIPNASFRSNATDQDYCLSVDTHSITIQSPNEEGLTYGVQTLCQLVRANRVKSELPCLSIQDWPSIGWRAYQDDLTRGPCTTFDFLKRELDIGSYLKMNVFTYYMEYQYKHANHPKIGPEDGSLTPDELRVLVEYGTPLHVSVMGNQQSFAHFEKILAHEEYAPLRENSYVLTPAKEETYQLLDDLFANQIPILPFPFFNVCCDETSGIGDGPAKEMVEKYGVGGAYVKHILRIHDLITKKYGKRMMMWGDIILNHPDRLSEIPKDVIMMTWAYDARDSFEKQIVPFAQSGYDFFVCPGVSNWSLILPYFQRAIVNIQNFVRDGHKHGCMGVLNTDWDDDGRTFNAVNVYGYAWGAECSWNASETSLDDFNRRVGSVLFGEKGDRFGKAIDMLTQLGAINNSLFFSDALSPFFCKSIEAKREELNGQRMLKVVRSAMDLFEECQKDSTVNQDLLDYFIFGAQRLALIDLRQINRFEAALAYHQATSLSTQEARKEIVKAIQYIKKTRDAYVASRDRFIELWNRENKPYALDWVLEGGHKVYNVKGSYKDMIDKYDGLIENLEKLAESGEPLPSGFDIGLGFEVKSN